VNSNDFSSSITDLIYSAYKFTNYSNTFGQKNGDIIFVKYTPNLDCGGLTQINSKGPHNSNIQIFYRNLIPYTIYHEIAHVYYKDGGHTNKNSILNMNLRHLKSFTPLDLQGFKVHSRLSSGSRSPDTSEFK